MPEPRLPARATRMARSVARAGVTRFPGAAQTARTAYFQALNWTPTQHAAYTAWLAARARLSTAPDPDGPTLSVVLDVAGQSPDEARRSVARLLAQTYENWDLTITSDSSATPHVSRSRRHRYVVVEGSSLAQRVNAALEDCDGDLLVVVGPADVLYPDSLSILVDGLAADPDADLVYGGSDVAEVDVTREGEERVTRRDPFFTPGWNPELLHSMPYLGTVTLVRTSLALGAGGLRDLAGAELWDLQLRLTRGGAKVAHAEAIVAGRLAGTPVVADAVARTVLDAALAAEGTPGCTIARGHLPGTWSVRYPLHREPSVSIVIPSRNAFDVVRRCVESIYDTTAYRSYEVVLVDTGSDDEEVLRWYEEMAALHDTFRVVDWPEQPFSYARSCNAGAEAAQGDVLVMLNNDTEVLDPSWLEVLVAEAERPEVGIVGCLLLYPDRLTVQHAGIGVGIKTAAGNSLSGLRLDGRLTRTQQLMLWTRRATTAVTAACVAIRKATYDEVGGFDETFRITFNDVDLCLRLGEAGYRSVYTPDVRLLHHESKTIAPTRDWTELFAARDLFQSRWGHVVAHDPQFNRHLSRATTSYRLPFHGR